MSISLYLSMSPLKGPFRFLKIANPDVLWMSTGLWTPKTPEPGLAQPLCSSAVLGCLGSTRVHPGLLISLSNRDLKGSFQGDIDRDMDIDIDVEVDVGVDIDRYVGCLLRFQRQFGYCLMV